MERRATLALLSNPTFLSLWIASSISNLGGLIQAVGAGWLMTSLATSNDMVALVQSSTNLTLIVFPLQAGALADNFDRRQIMIWAQVIMLAISAVLAGLTYLGMMTPWLLLIFTLALGSSGALYNPSWQASFTLRATAHTFPSVVCDARLKENHCEKCGSFALISVGGPT